MQYYVQNYVANYGTQQFNYGDVWFGLVDGAGRHSKRSGTLFRCLQELGRRTVVTLALHAKAAPRLLAASAEPPRALCHAVAMVANLAVPLSPTAWKAATLLATASRRACISM